MLYAVLPSATVLGAVCVRIGALAVLLVVDILSFVAATVLPYIHAMSAHLTILERTFELPPVGPLEGTCAVHFILTPHACEPRAIGPKVAAFAFFGALLEHPVVEAAIGPDFNALPTYLIIRLATELISVLMLLKLLELEQVFDHIWLPIFAEYVHIRNWIPQPEALVGIAVGFGCAEHAHADGLAVDPVALKVGAIGPNQITIAASSDLIVDNGLVLIAKCASTAHWRLIALLMILVRHVALRCLLHSLYSDLSNLTCVLELPVELHGLDQAELAVLDAQGFVLIQALDLLLEKLDCFSWVVRATNCNS